MNEYKARRPPRAGSAITHRRFVGRSGSGSGSGSGLAEPDLNIVCVYERDGI